MNERARILERADLFPPPVHRREWTLRELFSIFQQRRWFLIGSIVGMTTLALVYCLLATPRFQATGQIEVQRETPGMFGLEQSVTGDAANISSDALETSMTIETNAKILQSSALALSVIKDLKLETTADYFPVHKAGFQPPPWIFFWRKPLEALSVPLDAAPNRRFVALKIFAAHLKVAPVAGTRLIDVSYSNPDPQLAAAIVRRLIEGLTEYQFQSRFRATQQASSWLASQLTSLKQQTESLEQNAAQLEQGTGMFGTDASHNLILARLEELNEALSAAESNRIVKEAIDQVAQSGDPELIAGLAGNAIATPEMANSLTLIQTLRARQASVQAEIDEDNARYGSAYPKMAELRGELEGIQKSIQEEVQRIGERAHTEYQVAQRAEDAASASLEDQKKIADATKDRAVTYELARQEADGSSDVYRQLLAKLKEAGVLEGLRSTNLTVVNGAMVPPTNRPHSPNVPLCFAAALAGGLFMGCAGALVREATDTSIRSINDLERTLGMPLAGMIPHIKRTILDDGVRSLRSTLLSQENRSSQTLLVTSAVPGEGKSRTAWMLAAALAHSGARVLLVDADMSRPSLHTRLNLENKSGLAEALTSSTAATVKICADIPGLSIVTAGAANGDGVLLASSRMEALLAEWRVMYEFVVLDGPPVLPVPEAALLSRFCDRTLLVVRYGSTTMQAIERSYQAIRRRTSPQTPLDVVMNAVPAKSGEFFAYYGHKATNYSRKERRHLRG